MGLTKELQEQVAFQDCVDDLIRDVVCLTFGPYLNIVDAQMWERESVTLRALLESLPER